MKKYYLHDESGQQGPFDIEDLKIKNITNETPIWHEGLADWTTAESVTELKAVLKAEIPPPFKIKNKTADFKIPVIDKKDAPSRKRKKVKIFSILGIALTLLLFVSGFFLYQNSLKQEKIHLQKAMDDATKQERENNLVKQRNLEENKKQQIEKQKLQIRNNWNEYIKVEHSSYTYKELGGISDLFITVTNNTDYTIDNVNVNVSYIKTNGTIYKTETISFHGIAPQYKMKKKAPDSERGTSVDFLQITSISSKGLNFCYEIGNWAKESNDPYKCD